MRRKAILVMATAGVLGCHALAVETPTPVPPLIFEGATKVVAYFMESPKKEDKYVDRNGVERTSGGRMLVAHPKDSEEIVYQESLEAFEQSKAAVAHTQVAKLHEALVNKKGCFPVAACYDPHHALVFFDKGGKAVGCVEVCFSCKQVRVKPDFRELDQVDFMFERSDLLAIGKIFKHAGIPLEPYTSIDVLEKWDAACRQKYAAEISRKLGMEKQAK